MNEDKRMELWRRVEKTNPAHTKKVNFGRSITAIDPYRQMENATAEFGPAGKGWGWDVKRVEYLPTNEIGILISLWIINAQDGMRIEQWGQASMFIDKAELKKDTDCFKKATTDGITKCLSYMGFNADIFLGKYDDNKYVQQVTKEFKEADKPKPVGVTIQQILKAICNAATQEILKAKFDKAESIPAMKGNADIKAAFDKRATELLNG